MTVVASYRRYRSSHRLYDNLQGFEDQNILNVPIASTCTQVAGTLATEVLGTDRSGVPWRSWVRVHITGLG